jgi:hypothetical protein
MLRSFANGTQRTKGREQERKRERERERGRRRDHTGEERRGKAEGAKRKEGRRRERERGMGRRKMLGVGKTGERTEDIELKWPLGAHSSIPLSLP